MESLAWLIVGMLLGRIAYLFVAIYRLELRSRRARKREQERVAEFRRREAAWAALTAEKVASGEWSSPAWTIRAMLDVRK